MSWKNSVPSEVFAWGGKHLVQIICPTIPNWFIAAVTFWHSPRSFTPAVNYIAKLPHIKSCQHDSVSAPNLLGKKKSQHSRKILPCAWPKLKKKKENKREEKYKKRTRSSFYSISNCSFKKRIENHLKTLSWSVGVFFMSLLHSLKSSLPLDADLQL